MAASQTNPRPASPGPRRGERRPLSRGKKFGFSVAGTFIFLALFGLGSELVFAILKPERSFNTWRRDSLTYLLDEDVDWKLEPRLYPWGEVNADFFRGQRVTKERVPGTLRIALLGGSAAFDMWKRDEETWAEELERELSGVLRRPVEVLNAGTPGYSTWQSVRLLESRILAYDPDLVLVYHLYNDSLYFRFDDRDKIADAWRLNARSCYMTDAAHEHAVWDTLSLFFPRTTDFLRAMVVEAAIRELRSEAHKVWKDTELRSEVHPVGFGLYETNLRRMAKLLEPRRIPLGLVTQASIIREQNTKAERQRIHYAYRGLSTERLWKAYQDAYAVPDKIAATHPHVFVIKAHERVPVDSRLFVDEVHLTKDGSRLLARVVTKGVVDHINQSLRNRAEAGSAMTKAEAPE